MGLYHLPPDTKEKEKVLGGLFTWNQFFWFLGGFAIGMIGFVIVYATTQSPVLSIIVALLGISLSLPFVFFKKGELTLFQYITRKRRFNRKTHILINRRTLK